jgi:AraC family transcriptional regulator
LTLADLAQQAGLSEFHFARMFRQSLNMAPHQYVIGTYGQNEIHSVPPAAPDRPGSTADRDERRSRPALNMAPHQYVMQQRMAKAQNLICHSALPLTEIALACVLSALRRS